MQTQTDVGGGMQTCRHADMQTCRQTSSLPIYPRLPAACLCFPAYLPVFMYNHDT